MCSQFPTKIRVIRKSRRTISFSLPVISHTFGTSHCEGNAAKAELLLLIVQDDDLDLRWQKVYGKVIMGAVDYLKLPPKMMRDS